MLGGDDKQLLPQMITTHAKDEADEYVNRHVEDGELSALAFYKINSWPIYRLHSQFRMARGLFDMCHEMFYSDVPFKYTQGCDPDEHTDGIKLETYLRQRFPDMTPSNPGLMEPIFVHCAGSITY